MDSAPRCGCAPLNPARLEALSEVLKAMAHPTRLALLLALAEAERPVGALQAVAGGDLSTVSKHLKQMRSVGLLASERRGTQVWYRLATPCAVEFLHCVDGVVRARADRHLEAVT